MSGATNNRDGSKKRWLHGRAVQNGELRFLSVSSLEKGDSSKPTGCLRRWHYQYVGGIKEPPSDAMERGEKLHAEIAHYLTTGENILSSQAMAGLHMMPEPGPDLLVEHDIVPEMPDGKSGLAYAKLKAAGIPIVGAIDLIHSRGTNKGTNNIEEIYDPEGTVEVLDWKSCRTIDNAKTGPALLKTIQMTGYGKYVFESEPSTKLVRLSHGYFPRTGTPRKSTIRVDRDQIEKSWEHSNRVASSIKDAAKEINPDLVDANTQACNSYGRQCPAYSVCSAVKSNVLAKFVGNVLAEQLIPTGNLTKNMSNNSILAQIKAKNQEVGPTAPTSPKKSIFDQVGTAPNPPSDDSAKLAAEMARLAAEEAAARASQEPPQILPPDAPESNPLIAAKPLEATNTFTEAMSTVVTTEETVETAPPVETKKKASKKKEKPVVEVKVEAPVVTEENTTDSTINLYVDCSVEGVNAESFWPFIDHLIGILNEKSGGVDYRLNPDFEFGKWKGALAACIRQTVIPAGNYSLPHASGEVAQVVIETMRDIVRKSGGVFVKGSH